MTDIPSPTDVAVNILQWLGVPAIILLPLVFALQIAEWWKTGQQLRIGMRNVTETAAVLARRRPLRLILFILLQSLLVALVYSCFTLAHAMGVSDAAGRNIADGSSFTWTQLWMTITTYSTTAELPYQASLGAMGWLIALNITHVARTRLLVRILTMPAPLIVILAALSGLGIGIVGLIVLSLAWMHSPGYNVGMVSLYAAWVIILWGIAAALPACVSQAEQIYNEDAQPQVPQSSR
jgi:membrane protein